VRNVSKVVLDSSALLAVIRKEPGAERVVPVLEQAVMSAVNFSEVIARVARSPQPEHAIRDVQQLIHDIRPFDTPQATLAGMLIVQTQPFGLSLGDRACLALGKQLGAKIVTADQTWKKLDLGVEIELIRESTSTESN
jgi:ribonuclease VapC